VRNPARTTRRSRAGVTAADAPVFEEYLNNPKETAPANLLTDICLPVV